MEETRTPCRPARSSPTRDSGFATRVAGLKVRGSGFGVRVAVKRLPPLPGSCFLELGFRGSDLCGLGFVAGSGFRVGEQKKTTANPSLAHADFQFRVSGFGLKVYRRRWRSSHVMTWFRVSGFGFQVSGFGFRVSSFGCRVSDFGLRVSGFEFRVSGFGFRVSGFGFRVSCTSLRSSSERCSIIRRSTSSRCST